MTPLTDNNRLSIVRPNIAAEWHVMKNGDRTPANVCYSSNKKAWWACPKGHEWEATINSRSQGSGCPYCSGSRPTPQTCLGFVNPQLASELHPTKNGDLTPQDVTFGSSIKVWWLCSEGHEWKARISSRSYGGNGCPQCKNSHGEMRVKKTLDRIGAIYKREWRFPNLRDKRTLPFDFVVGGKRIGVIEYHGEQHYREKKYWGGSEALEATQKRDKMKRGWCLMKGIAYLEIPYWDFDKIEGLVEGFVKGLLG